MFLTKKRREQIRQETLEGVRLRISNMNDDGKLSTVVDMTIQRYFDLGNLGHKQGWWLCGPEGRHHFVEVITGGDR